MTTLLAASLVVGTVFFGMGVAQEYIESPYDAAKVAAGELPPLGERLPDTPMVYPVTQEIGEHGGQFNVFALDNFPWNALTEEPARGPLALLMTQDNDFIPDIVLDYKQSDDNTSFELYLRPGMKWSNGDDFTSEDFTFKREYLSDDGWQKHLYPEGSTVEAPDDHTVIINFPGPRPRALLDMIHWRGGEWTLFNPSNYLKPWR
ncbi:MAG: ABC transporter substrate-binding protein, partial [Deinococcales bacterium]|nr:ABC transporter substrate-binding protein [Deinococcales bacterium]